MPDEPELDSAVDPRKAVNCQAGSEQIKCAPLRGLDADDEACTIV
jgi:hypothetical protein